MHTDRQTQIYQKGDLEQEKKKNRKKECSKSLKAIIIKQKELNQHVNMKTPSVLINITTDLIPHERCSEVDWKKPTSDCTIGTHLAVKKPVKPFKLIDNEPGKIGSKGAHARTAENVRHRLVRPTGRFKSFAAGQQDHEMKCVSTNYQNHRMNRIYRF